MRSQTSKPIPKKGSLSKTTFKTNPHGKLTKKQALLSKPTKNTNVNKNVGKHKNNPNREEDKSNSSSDSGSALSDKNASDVAAIAGTSQETETKIECSNKKPKKDLKEKKEQGKNTDHLSDNKTAVKKVAKTTKKKLASKSKTNSDVEDNDNVKYKINLDVIPKNPPKGPKGKTFVKKKNAPIAKKKGPVSPKIAENLQKKDNKIDTDDVKNDTSKAEETQKQILDNNIRNETEKVANQSDSKSELKDKEPSKTTTSESSKAEHDRPPKFFTSIRSPRTVDIDVKCFKNSKGNLSMSERFLSLKCEPKPEEKSSCNTLVGQGPEMDVYTFSEKVDSPKSILADFRSPMTKTIGRVRPIARVKGTIIDKKSDLERKKYSPHRPIEEVVKQLKASKQTEDQNLDQGEILDALKTSLNSEDMEDTNKPKPLVSKSYKMVARKSSVTGKPFSPLRFDQDVCFSKPETISKSPNKKPAQKSKKQQKKSISDDELDTCKFSLNTSKFNYASSDESVNESTDDHDSKESSESDSPKNKKNKTKKYKRITDGAKKSTSKELKELSKDSLIDLKEASTLLGGEKPSKRRLKLLSMWTGPKKHRMASLNAIAKVHCLYENESRTHLELGLMKTVDRQIMPSTSKASNVKKKEVKLKEVEKVESSSTSDSEYENVRNKKDESSESSDDSPPQRTLRGVPGIRSAGKYWDPKSCSSSSEDSEHESKKKIVVEKKKTTVVKNKNSEKSDADKPSPKMKKTAGVPVKKKRNRNEVVMDLKDMVVQKRMASLNATAILAASYEKRSPKSSKDDTTSDSCSDESFSQKAKIVSSSAIKSEVKKEETSPSILTKKEIEEPVADRKQKVEVIVNQDTDVTITGVYSTHHHEGFCTVSGMQYRISSTSHTQTTATANCDKESCSREDARYTPLSALSSMQPPEHAHAHPHPHPVGELGGLARRPGCSSAFSAPSPSAHHEPGYYQPAGPLIKETGADAERSLARYHPPHYHPPHPPMLQQYGPSYYPPELCYGRYYRPPGPYHMPAPDAQIVGVGSEPYPPQFYGTSPCYQHSPRIPYVEYRACPCPLNACPKNVHIGPVTGKAPTGAGPDAASAGSLRAGASHALPSGKDPPEPEPPAATDAPHPYPVPSIGGASPKRELLEPRPAPPSPARGSAGVCATPPAPRPARLGKAMARRFREHTSPREHTNANDVLPALAPIDLSSPEPGVPTIDVKKENEGVSEAPPRKPVSALKEHNSPVAELPEQKPTKRRYSRPKLEIDMKDVTLEESCKTNGIGEHVKLQKRRKVSGDHTETPKVETVTKEPKRKASVTRRTLKTPPSEKKGMKRKLEHCAGDPKPKKLLLSPVKQDPRLQNVAALQEEPHVLTSKAKSAPTALDNLLRKNSINRDDSVLNVEKNPAELFLSSKEKSLQNIDGKIHSINNNILQNSNTMKEVLTSITSLENQLLKKKAPNNSSCKLDVVDSKICVNSKSVLRPAEKAETVDEPKISAPCDVSELNNRLSSTDNSDVSSETRKNMCDILKSDPKDCENSISYKCDIVTKSTKPNKLLKPPNKIESKQEPLETKTQAETETKPTDEKTNCNLTNELKGKAVEKLVKHLALKKAAENKTEMEIQKEKKRSKLAAEKKEKVAKLLVSKKSAIKTDTASLVIEDACSSWRRGRGRRSGPRRRVPPVPALPAPASSPRWSNGWTWSGEHYLARVYLNNDARLDRLARCWGRMTHAGGDSVRRGDCVLLRASVARAAPFVARVASLWENPDDGEMMVSLVWYYRPEHTELGRQPSDAPDEVFASKHRDANSVACIEDKCYVLTFNEYCRYRKRLKAIEEGIQIQPSIVPPMPASEVTPAIEPNDSKLPPSVSPELVLFCRKIYDFRSKKIQVPNK